MVYITMWSRFVVLLFLFIRCRCKTNIIAWHGSERVHTCKARRCTITRLYTKNPVLRRCEDPDAAPQAALPQFASAVRVMNTRFMFCRSRRRSAPDFQTNPYRLRHCPRSSIYNQCALMLHIFRSTSVATPYRDILTNWTKPNSTGRWTPDR